MGDQHNRGEKKEIKTQKTYLTMAAIFGGATGGSMSSMIKKAAHQLSEDETPDPELKGKYEGNCNRTACQRPGAVWYNHSTREHYCSSCASTLNKVNRADAMRMFGHDLCTIVEK